MKKLLGPISILFLLLLSEGTLHAQSEHEVEKGQTLYSIAQQYDVSVKKLMELNELEEANDIEPGHTLQIPSPSADTKDTVEHVVEEGETLYSICQQYQADIDAVLQLNPDASKEVEIGQTLRIPVGTKSGPEESEGFPFDTSDTEFHYQKVEKGQTLFSLSQKYDVSIQRIRDLNSHLEAEPEVGQLLRFPKGEDKGGAEEKVEEKQGTVRVEKGQTLYSISQEYGVSVEELKKANPDVEEGGLEPDQVLRIPGHEGKVESDKDLPILPRSLSDTIIFHTVEKGESVRSIATLYGTDPLLITLANELFFTDLQVGQLLLVPIPEKEGKEPPAGSELKEEYRVTLLLPLYPEANDSLLEEPFDEEPEFHGPSKYALEFYEGLRIAADSVASKGGSFEIHTICTRKGQKNLEKQLREKEVRESDLVIGPFYKENLERTAKALKGSGVHIACPVRHSNKVLLEGPHVSKVIPSRITLLKQLSAHTATEHGHRNVLLVRSGKEKEERLERIFKERFDQVLSNKNEEEKYRDSLKALEVDELENALVKDSLNILCVPSEEKVFASKLMNRISKMNDDVKGSGYPVRIYASEVWKNFETIDTKRKEGFGLHVITGRHILHDSLPTQRFYQAYRERNHSDPSKYGFLGYDAGLFYLSALSRYGTSFPERFEQMDVPTLHVGMDLYRTGVRSGYENRHAFIIRYTEDHRIERKPLLRKKEQ